MSKNSRKVVGWAIFVIAVIVIYQIVLFFSNLINPPDKADGDIHGVLVILITFLIPPLTVWRNNYVKTGKFFAWPSETGSIDSQVATPSMMERVLKNKNTLTVLAFLSVAWLLAPAYCKLVADSIRASLTDKTIISSQLTGDQVDRLTTAIRGTLYYAIFFPVVALSAFLAGWLAQRRLKFAHLLIPAIVFYGAVNIVALIRHGQLLVVAGVRRVVKAAEQVKHGSQESETGGDTALIIFISVVVFCIVVLQLALFSWMWTAVGRYLKRRFYLKNIVSPNPR